jgi:Uma2 family endonuclease
MTLNPPTVELEPEDLERLRIDDLTEFVNGHYVEKQMGMESSRVSARVTIRVGTDVLANNLGELFDAANPCQCFPNDPSKVRKPDASFVAAARLPGSLVQGNMKIAPDLAVEVISPNDEYEEVEATVADYRSAGVKLIWIVSPKAKTVLVRRLDRTCTELDETGILDGEDVIPGFTCPVADLFA